MTNNKQEKECMKRFTDIMLAGEETGKSIDEVAEKLFEEYNIIRKQPKQENKQQEVCEMPDEGYRHSKVEKLTDNQFKELDVLKCSLQAENNKQIRKWGIQTHHIMEWLAFTTEELGELSQAISEHYYRKGKAKKVYYEAIQTATLALKIAEMYYPLFIEEASDE